MLHLPVSAQNKIVRQDITESDIKTLTETQSEKLSIMGLNLSMTYKETQLFLEKSDRLIGEQDTFNLQRIYVYEKTSDGGKGKALLYLIWDGQIKMKQITVFADFKSYLSDNFRKLLTSEALDKNSEFTKSFIGLPRRSAITLDIESIGT